MIEIGETYKTNRDLRSGCERKTGYFGWTEWEKTLILTGKEFRSCTWIYFWCYEQSNPYGQFLMTVLAGLFIWMIEQKEGCEVVNITTCGHAIIYIPIGKGSVVDNNGFPGLQIPKFPGVIESGKQKRFVIMPQGTGDWMIRWGWGCFGGLVWLCIWGIGGRMYTYDFMLSHQLE